MSEAELQRAVIELAKWCGWMVVHFKPAQRSGSWATHFDGDVGFPDLVLAHPERGVVFAELKTARGKVTAGQQAWLCALSDAGQDAVVWRPDDWPTILQRLQGGQ
jgi:hypothetical protein